MRLRITINGRVYEAEVEPVDAAAQDGAGRPEAAVRAVAATPAAPVTPSASAAGGPRPAGDAGGPHVVRAPLPGVVSDLRVEPGQRVAAGEVLVVLEAMKMDNDVASPVSGVVRAVHVARGEQVAAEQALVVLE